MIPHIQLPIAFSFSLSLSFLSHQAHFSRPFFFLADWNWCSRACSRRCLKLSAVLTAPNPNCSPLTLGMISASRNPVEEAAPTRDGALGLFEGARDRSLTAKTVLLLDVADAVPFPDGPDAPGMWPCWQVWWATRLDFDALLRFVPLLPTCRSRLLKSLRSSLSRTLPLRLLGGVL